MLATRSRCVSSGRSCGKRRSLIGARGHVWFVRFLITAADVKPTSESGRLVVRAADLDPDFDFGRAMQLDKLPSHGTVDAPTRLPSLPVPEPVGEYVPAGGAPPWMPSPGAELEPLPVPELAEEEWAYDPEIEAGVAALGAEDLPTMVPDLSGEKQREEWAKRLVDAWLPEQQQRLETLARERQRRGGKDTSVLPPDPYAPVRELPGPSTVRVADMKLRKNGGLRNILEVLRATRPDEMAYWKDWYNFAQEDAYGLADKYNVPMETAAGVIAALSPNVVWEKNVLAAEQMLRGVGEDVIRYRHRMSERAQGDMMATLFPEMFVDTKTLGTFSYLDNIKKAQAVLDQWDEHGYFDDTPPGEYVVSWDPEDDASVQEAHAQYADAMRKGYSTMYTQGAVKTPKNLGLMEDFDSEAKYMLVRSPIAGPKVTAFYKSILEGDRLGDEVVLDGHAMNIWRGAPRQLSEVQVQAAQRDRMVKDYKRAANVFRYVNEAGEVDSLTPQQVQAVTWAVWRDAIVDEKKKWRKGGALRSPLGIKELRRWADDPSTTFAAFSAQRHEGKATDKAKHRQLLQDLNAMGFKDSEVRQVAGKWWDEKSGGDRPEQSVIVRNIDFEDARWLAERYDQDAIIYKDPSGVIGMYDFKGSVRVPTKDGEPLLGSDALRVEPQKAKPPSDRAAPGQLGEDLYSGSRSTSWEFAYDWDDNRSLLPWEGSAEYTADDVFNALTPRDEPPAQGSGGPERYPDEHQGPAHIPTQPPAGPPPVSG